MAGIVPHPARPWCQHGSVTTFAGATGPRTIHAATLDLDWLPVPEDQAITGHPRVGTTEVALAGDLEVGVWAHTPGTSTDVESDEVFVVLAGRATVEFTDGTVLEMGPGDLGILPAGASTRWTVHETLRKVYVVRAAP